MKVLTGSAPYAEGAGIDAEAAAYAAATARMEGQAEYLGVEVDRATVTFKVLSRQGRPGQKLLVVSSLVRQPNL